MRIILKFENTKFRYFADAATPRLSKDGEIMFVDLSEEKTGTVIYAADVVEDYPDELLPWGSEDGINYKICLHEPFMKFQDTWRESVLAAKGCGVMDCMDRRRIINFKEG